MTVKYLYILGYSEFSEVYYYVHIPVDKYIFDIFKKEFNIKKQKGHGIGLITIQTT